MKSTVISKAAYVAAHGVPVCRAGSVDPEIKALWSKLVKLQAMPPGSNGNGAGEYLIVEPNQDEDLKRIRARVYGGLRSYMRRQSPRTFVFRMLRRPSEHHVLLWKEPLPAQPQAATADHAELTAKAEASGTAHLPLPRDKREKVRHPAEIAAAPAMSRPRVSTSTAHASA